MNEIKVIEDYLFRNMKGEDVTLFEAQLLLNSELAEKVQLQKKVYHLIHQCGRNALKEEIQAIHDKLFIEPRYSTFRKRVLKLFFNQKD
ncbi:hypothetical protein C900_03840 [Fulvivirga imtechensis AK7]|uniref:Uncharacterized protein n=1 Tax=Fulvivirga imtechensis AK7 TaxID=1237149 RepID=L8JMU3_9BACT|nr:hypothetical protein C900_03840 [Fulvivirga imtechensis AK7]